MRKKQLVEICMIVLNLYQITYIGKIVENLNSSIQSNDVLQLENKLLQIQEQTTIQMDQLRESIWAVGSENMTIKDIILKLNAYGSKMSKEYSIPYQLVGSLPNVVEIRPNKGLHVYRILHEAINNAFNSSGATQISIECKVLEDKLV